MTTPSPPKEAPTEDSAIAARRAALAQLRVNSLAQLRDDSLAQLRDDSASDSEERVALALSGGGIRSATFSLGVVQAMAEAPRIGVAEVREFKDSLLSRIDYLSTVSGGGYLGGFLCSLFLPGRLKANVPEPPASQGWRARLMPLWRAAWAKLSSLGEGWETKSKKQGAASPHESEAQPEPPAESQSHEPGADAAEEPGAGAPSGPPSGPPAKSPMAVAADDALAVLTKGPPQRIRADASIYTGEGILSAPLSWLRENGRYLMPTGSGDALYVMAIGLRNWLSVHCVIGTVMIAFVSVLTLLRAFAATYWSPYGDWERALLEAARNACLIKDSALTDHIWWSPLSVLWLMPVLTVGLVMGVAYWLVHEDPKGNSRRTNSGVAAMALIGVVLTVVACVQWPEHAPALFSLTWRKLQFEDAERSGEVLRMVVTLVIGVVALSATLLYVLIIARWPSASKQRVLLTRGLQASLTASLVIAVLAVIDTLGQTLYLAAFRSHAVASTLSPAALAGALSWLAQRLAKSNGAKLPDALRKLPLMSLAGIAGMAIFVLVGALWAMAVHVMIWGGTVPDPTVLLGDTQLAILGWLVGVSFAIALATGLFPGFINMSSLQPFYASRLTRAYLGASNGQRFRDTNEAKRSAAEPMARDQIQLSDFYCGKEITTLAPLHIINVCVNKTVDPAEQLVQRDRKGQPLAVLPFGLSLDGEDVRAFDAPKRWSPSSVDRPLNLGQWIGTSGAAFSTGIGRETTLGMSLLMGAANVRLGTWWPTGADKRGNQPSNTSDAKSTRWLREGVGLLFRTQRYLSYELRASFHGTHRTWQYLSDGGHFENTGLYELLRPHRKVEQIFVSDNGADPAYQFDDLANLIRLARIDMQVDVRLAKAPLDKTLAALYGQPEDFKPFIGSDGKPLQPAAGAPIAVLLYAWPIGQSRSHGPTQIVLIKPHVTSDVPADVRQYAVTHRPFPQEPTADQFFDEAQWESYRALGYCQAKRLFRRDVLVALKAHRAREIALERGDS
ncbi:patatin-like phospholipase family protein [Aquabacterium humicola]|uniref:patatin-like phospholipase family protein n=1 Tax=Aquabacterium humicola TaxID=3237377 RepID=UPI002542A75D|nr:patatin-like phospholipase family protein [Rubrivivax pictus]